MRGGEGGGRLATPLPKRHEQTPDRHGSALLHPPTWGIYRRGGPHHIGQGRLIKTCVVSLNSLLRLAGDAKALPREGVERHRLRADLVRPDGQSDHGALGRKCLELNALCCARPGLCPGEVLQKVCSSTKRLACSLIFVMPGSVNVD